MTLNYFNVQGHSHTLCQPQSMATITTYGSLDYLVPHKVIPTIQRLANELINNKQIVNCTKINITFPLLSSIVLIFSQILTFLKLFSY